MTIGDMVNDQVELLTTQSLDIDPASASVEWAIHNIYIPIDGTCEIYRTDGTLTTLFMTVSNSLLSYNFHCSLYSYITVKNIGTSTITVGYDGLIMQE
jgi:hypothetical protein